MSEAMNEGVRLLIERMKTNPEEFEFEEGALYSSNKWGKFVHNALVDDGTFSEEERDAVKSALHQVRRELFTANVIRTLTTTDENYTQKTYAYQPSMTLSSSGSLGIGTVSPTIKLGNTSLNEADLKRIKSAIGGTK